MIKSIVFDLGGVIFTSDGVSYEGREKFAEDFSLDKESLHKFWFERKEKMITGRLSEDDYLKELISANKLEIPLEEFKKNLRSRNILDKKMIEVLRLLKKKYKLFALTNDVKEWIDYRIKEFNLEKYFELIVSSSDVGYGKPDIRIYRELIKIINISPKDILFVDNREENLKPAEGLGMKTYHFRDSSEFIKWLEEENILEFKLSS